MTCGLSSLDLRVRRWGGRVNDDDVPILAHRSKIHPVVTKQATIIISMEESKQNCTRTAVPGRKRSGAIMTCCTRSRNTFLQENTRNIAVVHAYTRKIKL